MFYSLPVRKPVLALETCNNLDLSIFVRNGIICHLSEPKSCWFLAICTYEDYICINMGVKLLYGDVALLPVSFFFPPPLTKDKADHYNNKL